MRTLFLVLAAALVALPAYAWNDCGIPGSSADVSAVVSPTGRRTICHDTAANTATDSSILTVSQCDHIDIQFDPDSGGTATGADAYIYRCSYPEASTSYCTKMLVDTDGDGVPNDVTLDGSTVGRIGQQWQTAAWIYVDMNTAPGSGDYARTMVVCY
jgi:hypothetical protein